MDTKLLKCGYCENEQRNIEFTCLSPLCLYRLKSLCKDCAVSQFHEDHKIVKVESIFRSRNGTVENSIKYYELNLMKLEEKKEQQSKKLQSLINTITNYMDDITQSIDRQIAIQKSLIQEIIRTDSIAKAHYDYQLENYHSSVFKDLEKMISINSICPAFEITNIIQEAEILLRSYENNINKANELEEITNCVTKNLEVRNFSTKEADSFLKSLQNVKDISDYRKLQFQEASQLKPINLLYSSEENEMRKKLPAFTSEIVPYIQQTYNPPEFDTMSPSKLFYDTNFSVIINKYFSQGDSLVSMNFRQIDERYFKIPPFIQGSRYFKSLRNLSVNINSTELPKFISFLQNHPQLTSLDILINADQQLLTTAKLKYLFSSQSLPNIKHLKLDITRLNFSSSIEISEIQGFFDQIKTFFTEKRSSLQTFQLDGLIEFTYNIDQMNSILFDNDSEVISSLKFLTFLVTNIDIQLDQQSEMLDKIHTNVLHQMPFLRSIKLFKMTEFLDVQRFFQIMNSQLKTRHTLVKLLMIIKSRLKTFRKEVILTIINEFISSIHQIII